MNDFFDQAIRRLRRKFGIEDEETNPQASETAEDIAARRRINYARLTSEPHAHPNRARKQAANSTNMETPGPAYRGRVNTPYPDIRRAARKTRED